MMDLAAPFPFEAIHWRAQSVTRSGDKALALAYLDARDVMDRLDIVCSPFGWQSSFTETASGRVLCKLEILQEGVWIAKMDGAGNTAVEGEKGGISDALKRAAVQWGIGRYLYDLGNVWAPCESYEVEDRGKKRKKWKAWKPEARQVFEQALKRLGLPPVATITEAQRSELMLLMEGLNFPPARLLAVSKISDLRELPAEKFEGAKGWIQEQSKEKEAA